jgi:hypothetical protein
MVHKSWQREQSVLIVVLAVHGCHIFKRARADDSRTNMAIS